MASLSEHVYTADRDAVIRGLLDLAMFLVANPDVPADEMRMELYTLDDGDLGHDVVDRIAGLIGVEAKTLTHDHYRAERSFGPVTYAVTRVPGTCRVRGSASGAGVAA